jgi:hypothetical protein
MPAGMIALLSVGVLVRGLIVYNKHLPLVGSKVE